MNVAVMSAFANAVPYLDRYLAQMDALRQMLQARGDTLRCIWGEGDSHDDTRAQLAVEAEYLNVTLLDVTHGGQLYGSVVNNERFRLLARVWARIWDEIREDDDIVLVLESDLIWRAADILRLIDHTDECPVVGGMVWLGAPRGFFYDTWAYRQDWLTFRAGAPWFPGQVNGEPLVEVDSIGSIVAMRGDIARQFRPTENEVIVGFCRQVRNAGYTVWVDRQVDIIHP